MNSSREEIYMHSSPDLKMIIRYTNIYSINLYAEAILKAIGLKQKKEASTKAGAEAIQEYWQKEGIDTQGLYITDGSGLAGSNGLTAGQLCEIMYKTSKKAWFNDFYFTLPVAGVSGTMASVGLGTKAQNNLRAKSGGMTRVISYTGYFQNTKSKKYVFSLIANQYNCNYAEIKAKLSQLMGVMVEGV